MNIIPMFLTSDVQFSSDCHGGIGVDLTRIVAAILFLETNSELNAQSTSFQCFGFHDVVEFLEKGDISIKFSSTLF